LLGAAVVALVVSALARSVRMRREVRRQAHELELAELLGAAASKLRTELGRTPTRQELLAAAGYVRIPKTIRFWEEAVVPGRALLASRAAERKLMLALVFLPSEQRARYQREWRAEMASLNPQDAAAFALQILRHAPMVGLTFVFKEVFGRKAA
ncbi:hypothetical protein, partial [Streptomyces lavendulae]